jgi:sulfur carrier protein ThiS
MRITVKLFASLSVHLPAGASQNQANIEVPEGSSPSAVIRQLNVPPEQCHLVLVNGTYIQLDRRSSHLLNEGDVLAIWPPVAGG